MIIHHNDIEYFIKKQILSRHKVSLKNSLDWDVIVIAATAFHNWKQLGTQFEYNVRKTWGSFQYQRAR